MLAPSHTQASARCSSRRHLIARPSARSALEMRLPETVEERIYNCSSAQELVDDGISEDLELRLFEVGWSGTSAYFVEEPLFLVTSPALIRKWAQIPGVSHV